MIFSTEFNPLLEDFDKNGRLTLFAVLKFLENAGSRHSDVAGDSAIEVSGSQGVAWVLTDWKIAVSEFPSYGQSLKVETWSEGLVSPFGTNRNFYMYSDGALCVEGTTKWIRLDINSGRPVKVSAELLDRYGPEPDKKVFGGEKLSKIALPENFSSETKITLRRSDLDFNNHVHNLNYLDFAFEALPKEIIQNAHFKNLRISYKTALKEGDAAICKYASTGALSDSEKDSETRHIVCVYSDKDSLAAAIELF